VLLQSDFQQVMTRAIYARHKRGGLLYAIERRDFGTITQQCRSVFLSSVPLPESVQHSTSQPWHWKEKTEQTLRDSWIELDDTLLLLYPTAFFGGNM
jgi:hypothetical protein